MSKFNALLRSLARPPAFQQGLFDAARGIGATPVMLEAQRQAEEKKQMLSTLLNAAVDPAATSATLTETSRSLMNIDKELGLQVAAQAKEAALEEERTRKFGERRDALINTATNLGFEDIATSIQSISDQEELADVAKDLRKRVLDLAPTQTLAQRRFMANGVGISPQKFKDLDLANMEDDAFNTLISGQGGELEPFLIVEADGTSKVVQKRVNKGLVWDNEAQTWKTAEELGLQRPPPQVRVVENINNTLGPELVEEGVKLFAESTEDARKAAESLNSVNRSLPLIDNMFTGMGAEVKLNIARFGRFFGIEMADPKSIADTEVYLADSGRRVAQYITNLGAGTGLSDADRQYAQSVVGGDISVDAEAMKRILLIAKSANEGILAQYYERRGRIRDALEEKGQEGALEFFPTPVLNEPLGSAAPATATLRWDENRQDFVPIL
tara:strand:- start:3142 stop:4467 length:1326 start_codon:yes stop_codon:yes gene_type:complete